MNQSLTRWTLWNWDLPINLIPMKLINTHHLVGAFIANSLTEMFDNPLRTYRGKDCIETFCNYIKGEARRLYHMFPELPMDPLTKKQWKKYK